MCVCVCFSGPWRQLHGPVRHADGQQTTTDPDVAAEPVHGRLWHPVRRHHTGNHGDSDAETPPTINILTYKQ